MEILASKALRLMAALFMSPMLLTGCDASPAPSSKAFGRVEAKVRFSQINDLHKQSCMCRLAGNQNAGLANRLSIAKDGLAVNGTDAGAIPVRHSVDCYPALGPSACITTYSLSTLVGGGEVCTSEQWREIEEVFEANGGSSDKATVAIKKRLAEIRQAAASTIPQAACN